MGRMHVFTTSAPSKGEKGTHLTEVSEHPPAVEYAAAYWKLLYELRVTALPTQAPLVRPAYSSMRSAAGPRLKTFMLGKTLDQKRKGSSRCSRLSRGQSRIVCWAALET